MSGHKGKTMRSTVEQVSMVIHFYGLHDNSDSGENDEEEGDGDGDEDEEGKAFLSK